MSSTTRNIILALCAFCILASLAAYAATGAAAFTRYPSDEIEQSNEQDDLAALFDDSTGLHDEQGEIQGIDNRFTLGLLPSGPGRDAASVATITGPALLLGAVSFLLARRNPSAGMDCLAESTDTPNQ